MRQLQRNREGGAPVKFPQALNIMNTMAMLLIFKLTHCQINISQENSGAFGSVHPHPPTMKSILSCDYVLTKWKISRNFFQNSHFSYFTFALFITFQLQHKLKPKDYFFVTI